MPMSRTMIELLIDDAVACLPLPPPQAIEAAVHTTLRMAGMNNDAPLCIRFADDDAVQALNKTWRNKDCVTDVLSFPMQERDAIHPDESLGDIILAVPFVAREAARLELGSEPHVLHLIIHGVLHLLGYDHMNDDDAEQMQQLEKTVMQQLKLHEPYPENDQP